MQRALGGRRVECCTHTARARATTWNLQDWREAGQKYLIGLANPAPFAVATTSYSLREATSLQQQPDTNTGQGVWRFFGCWREESRHLMTGSRAGALLSSGAAAAHLRLCNPVKQLRSFRMASDAAAVSSAALAADKNGGYKPRYIDV